MPNSPGASAPDFQNRRVSDRSAASREADSKSGDFQTERHDWELFRTLETLGQMAGVPASRLRRLALKELVDNALDVGAEVTITEQIGGRYIVSDNGPGMDGSPEDVANLFSIDRPLRSTKQWRKPQRGALGNGLRVVAGSLIASGGGRLVVTTRGKRLVVTPRAAGGADVVAMSPDFPVTGTRIEIVFGTDMPKDDGALEWADATIAMSKGGPGYAGKSSAHWFDAQSFHELLRCSGARPVRDLIANLDGLTGAKAGHVVGELKGRSCNSLNPMEATTLLKAARLASRAPDIKKLGAVGKLPSLPDYYDIKRDIIEHGTRAPKANLPVVVEAWAAKAGDSKEFAGRVSVFINRTVIAGNVHLAEEDGSRKPTVWGCGLDDFVDTPKNGKWHVRLNVTTPFMPLTTMGKEPDLGPFSYLIALAIGAAIKKAQKAQPKRTGASIKEIVFEHMAEAVAGASGGHRAAMRQVFYELRRIAKEPLAGRELRYGTFESIFTDYENEHGEVSVVFRDNRGVLYEPWSDRNVQVGTLMTERYSRPPWQFNKLLFIEKEGFFEALKAERWPETHDCALLTSKGFASRAAKDLIDLLAEHDEPIKVFCAHDADSAGTMIYQSLQEATRARGARSIEIVDLGLQPWEAREMGLEPESFEKKERERPVADYVKARPDGDYWADWLQSNRYELNAMTMPQFLSWLTGKVTEHDVGKVIPPPTILDEEADRILMERVRDTVTERVLREADIDGQVATELEKIERPALTPEGAKEWLADHPSDGWRGYVEEIVQEVVENE